MQPRCHRIAVWLSQGSMSQGSIRLGCSLHARTATASNTRGRSLHHVRLWALTSARALTTAVAASTTLPLRKAAGAPSKPWHMSVQRMVIDCSVLPASAWGHGRECMLPTPSNDDGCRPATLVLSTCGCRLVASWLQAGCKLVAGWLQAGGRLLLHAVAGWWFHCSVCA